MSARKRESDDAIEQDLKRLRLAYDYDGAHTERVPGEWPDDDAMGELPQRARAVRGDYAEVNAMLREFHFLRQLRKFQAERRRARASVLERRADEAVTWRQEPRE